MSSTSLLSRFLSSISALLMPLIALTSLSFGMTGSANAAPDDPHGVVNINSASIEQLMLLPRVGESKAQRIIDFRQKTPFKTVNELGRVKGFGLKTLRMLKPLLRVDGPTTLTNEVSPEEAQQLAAAPEAPRPPSPSAKPASPASPKGR